MVLVIVMQDGLPQSTRNLLRERFSQSPPWIAIIFLLSTRSRQPEPRCSTHHQEVWHPQRDNWCYVQEDCDAWTAGVARQDRSKDGRGLER